MNGTKTFLWRAECSTRNFEFWAYGETKTEAKLILRATFERHIRERGGWMTWSEIKADVYYTPCKAGNGYVH